MFGRLTDTQRAVLRDAVAGEVVHDLGAGDGELADIVAGLGARSVIAVEKEERLCRPSSPKVRVVPVYVEHYVCGLDGPDPEVCLLSWPCNYCWPGLVNLLTKARKIIYRGKNTDGTACGTLTLFDHLLHRKILAHAPDKANSLTVYGAAGERRQPQTGEEYAALHTEHWISYEVAEEFVRSKPRRSRR